MSRVYKAPEEKIIQNPIEMGKGFESAHYQIDKWDVIQGYWNILNVVGK